MGWKRTIILCWLSLLFLGCAALKEHESRIATDEPRILIVAKDVSTYIGRTWVYRHNGVTEIYMIDVLELRFGIFMHQPIHVLMPLNAGVVENDTLLLSGNEYTICVPNDDLVREYLVVVQKVKEMFRPPEEESAENTMDKTEE